MELILERGLEHQQKAVDAIISALNGITMIKPYLAYENPTFDRKEKRLEQNIKDVQENIRADYQGCLDDGDYLNLDIKMETGTGKTYVYTQTIYEMHKKFGFNKFIIAVPSLPIKAGISQFIGDGYVKHHFSDTCGYNCDIELGILESVKKKKKGFLAMPPAVRDFVTGSFQNSNKIYVLLVNMQLLTNGNMLTRSDYDYLVEGFYRPFDALKATKPIVIIDEPHRFSRDQKAYKIIVEELCPQMIIRYGATFPNVIVGNKVIDVNKNKKEEIHVRKAVYSELKELWERINHKYYLFYDADLSNEIPQTLHDILRKTGILGNVTLESHRDQIVTKGNIMDVIEDSGVSYSVKRSIPYNEFLKRISQQTSIPIRELHKAMCELSKEKDIPDEYINEYSVANIVSAFTDWRIEKMQMRFKYKRSAQPVTETALTYKDGSPRDVIKQGNVGTKFVEGTPSDKYLYDKIVFDSPLEKTNITTDIDEVVVYGKIPKSSVAIPTIVGENYSPDFMYVVKHKDGTKELNIVVETKLVENKSTLRGIEDAKIKCAEAFFKQLTIDGYTVSFHTQLSNKKVKQIIDDVIADKGGTSV